MKASVAIALILLSVAGISRSAAAQDIVSPEALKVARTMIGTAQLSGVKLGKSDSLIVSVVDSQLTIEAFEEGDWQFGGRSERARSIGREIATAIRAGLPATSPIKTIVIEVVGVPAERAAIRFPYRVGDLGRQ